NRQIELSIDKNDVDALERIFPSLFDGSPPVVILVPGGAFGTSKCWPAIRFAETADRLIRDHDAKVIISVAPNEIEEQIAASICEDSKNELYNLANTPLALGQLKALYSKATLVITNDTGPRHIAMALGRKVVTLFGPNDPAWTKPDYDDEIEIVGTADCVPCAKPKCYKEEHLCMISISVDQVVNAAEELLGR
ncbi:MAG: glycosyltransferase family 9 protein, partial [Planctomycetes bacterium]|nr:glycosyltransferase family 9 protein [Planctomycetota bacterium]